MEKVEKLKKKVHELEMMLKDEIGRVHDREVTITKLLKKIRKLKGEKPERTNMSILEKIDGYKTYIALVLALVLIALKALEILTPEQFNLLIKFDAVFLGIGVRSALKKLE